MDFSQLKKTLSDTFTGVFGFWIAAGIIFFILILVFFIGIYPLSNQYAKSCSAIQDSSTALERNVLKKDLYNGKWIESKKREVDLYRKEIEECNSFLKEMDDRLEAVFMTEDPEKGGVRIGDVALWKSEYTRRIALLLEKIQKSNVILDKGALPFRDWGADIPPWDDILPVQKKFWIIEALIHGIVNDAGVVRLEKIQFRESSYSYDPSFAHLYTAIPVSLRAELRTDHINFLLHGILKSEIPFVIEGVTIVRTGKVYTPDRSLKNGDVPGQDISDPVSTPVIHVTVDAYVIDYKA
ncbi:MAG: hypothetical protein E3K32_01380 [wastewater metagenome]|nr:hypothetical protein [Candidatus Loosdrechtia aerotolerans]